MESIGHALGGVGVFLLPFAVLAWFFLTLAAPVLLWRFLRDVARTRRAVERIADAVESGRRPGPGGVLGI